MVETSTAMEFVSELFVIEKEIVISSPFSLKLRFMPDQEENLLESVEVVSVFVISICLSLVVACEAVCQVPFVMVPCEIVASMPCATKESVPPMFTFALFTAQTPTISVTMVRQNITIVENNLVLSFIGNLQTLRN